MAPEPTDTEYLLSSSLWYRQLVLASFAFPSGDMSFCSKSSNSVRSRINPASHVRKQIGGGVGCLA